MRPELMLGVAIVAELIGTTSMKLSSGFTKPIWTVLVVLGYVASLSLVTLALKSLPLGYTYAIWSAVGTIGSAVIGLWLFGETMTAVKVAGIGLVVTGIVVLNLGGAH